MKESGGFRTNTMHVYQFDGDDGMLKMQTIVRMFRFGFKTIGGLEVENILDYGKGLDGLPESDVINYRLAGGSAVVIRPSADEPKLNVYISIAGENEEAAAVIEERVCVDLDSIIYLDDRMGYCCE